MKRMLMFVCGLALVSAIALAVACGGGDKKKNDDSKTPEHATQTAVAAATVAAGGTAPTSIGGESQSTSTRGPVTTETVVVRATSQRATVEYEKTQDVYDRATEQSDSKTSDANATLRAIDNSTPRHDRPTDVSH
jgi:hypothetical protein